MRHSKLLFILLLLVIRVCVAQETPKAELVDEFGKITWEDYVARLDGLYVKLSEKPNSIGYIVIHNGKVSNNRERFRYEEYAKGHIKFRGFDEERIVVIRAEDRDKMRIQLWMVPEFAEKPSFVQMKWSSALPSNAKPYIFTKTAWTDELIIYSEYLVLDLFSEYLENNPSARGHFVIRAKSKKEFIKEREKISELLTEKYKIESSRLRFFYIRENNSLIDYYPDVEVWLVPKNKK